MTRAEMLSRRIARAGLAAARERTRERALLRLGDGNRRALSASESREMPRAA